MDWAKPRRRGDLPLVELDVYHSQPAAVGERHIEEVSLGARIIRHGGIEPNGDHPGPINLHRLPLDLEIHDTIIETQKAPRLTVSVGHPDDVGRSLFTAYLLPELVECVGFAGRGQHEPQDRVQGNGQLAQGGVRLHLQRGVVGGADDHPHQPIAVREKQVRTVQWLRRVARLSRQVDQRAKRQILPRVLLGSQGDLFRSDRHDSTGDGSPINTEAREHGFRRDLPA